MKKLFCLGSIILLIMIVAGTALANQENTGCGLGTMIFKDKDGLVYQVLAVTTNGTSGNQTFGISSGTLDCERPESFVSNKKINKFVAENMDNLATDIAQGNGEYLDTLAMLMEVPPVERTAVYSKLQRNFSNIFTGKSVTSEEILTNIESVLTAS